MTSMSSYEARRATFYPPHESGKSRKKATAQWPHPTPSASSSTSTSSSKGTRSFPSPSDMAHLGLFFDALAASSTNELDTCTLYPEELTFSGWKAGDVAADRVRKVEPKAAFLLIRDSKDAGIHDEGKEPDGWQWTEEDLLPNGKAMIAARWKTFASGWPYDGKKGWKPTSKKVAAAGFHFTPNEDEEDCVTCVYCDCSLGGWEKSDDPTKEHQRRRPGCAFFNCTLSKVKEPSTAKSRSVSGVETTKQQKARTVSKRKVREEEEEVDAEEEDSGAGSKAEKDACLAEKKAAQEGKAQTRSAEQEIWSHVRTKKHAPVSDDDDNLASSTASYAARKVAKNASMPVAASAPVVEEHVVPVEKQKENTASGQQQASTPSKDVEESELKDAKGLVTPPKKNEKELVADVVPAQQADIRKSTKPEPFSIVPLTTLNKFTAAEEQMTVEAWLKEQVTNACEEMEREGVQRIEQLREEIAKGRLAVESFLRGTNTASIDSAA